MSCPVICEAPREQVLRLNFSLMRETQGKEVNHSEKENDSRGKMRKKKVRRVFRPEQRLCYFEGKEMELNRRY